MHIYYFIKENNWKIIKNIKRKLSKWRYNKKNKLIKIIKIIKVIKVLIKVLIKIIHYN